jgi:hypothetical protein
MASLAIQDFLKQDWPNKELILACSGNPVAIEPLFNWAACLEVPEIRCEFAATDDGKPLVLGKMRNFTNDVAAGDWMATWDDDDRHHPERLTRHMRAAAQENADITYLNMQLHVFPDVQKIWWVDWRDFRSPGYVCYRKTAARYPVTGEDANRGEDKMFLRKLDADGYKFAKVDTQTPIYVRYFHGTNAWNRKHHEVLVQGHGVDVRRLQAHREQLVDFIKLMGIKGPLDFMCRNTMVFRYV